MTGKGTCGGYGDAPEIVAHKVVAAAAVSPVALSFVGSGCEKRVAGVFRVCLLDARDRWGCSCAGRWECGCARRQERGTEMAITVNLLVKTGLAA
ncbi:hypothetical protein NL676_035186 [Syzygium grande]|nr:hypothetical protein NL676_035186 [Syzygium grande]